jgi:hypothetical protein
MILPLASTCWLANTWHITWNIWDTEKWKLIAIIQSYEKTECYGCLESSLLLFSSFTIKFIPILKFIVHYHFFHRLKKICIPYMADMSSTHYMTTVHAWNSRIIPVLGFPLNALLIWLICTKTPKEMRVHSRILQQTCIFDSIFLLVDLIASPV